MPEITAAQVLSIPDPKVKAIADEVVQVVRLATEKATLSSVNPAVYKLAGGKSSFESILGKRFASLDLAQQASAEANVTARLARHEKTRDREFGRFAKIDLKKPGSVEQQVTALGPNKKLAISKAELENIATPLLGPVIPTSAATLAVFLPGTFPWPGTLYATPSLELRLHGLRCVDETGIPYWFGSEPGEDEIDLGGSQIDATGVTTALSQFKVGDFDDGDVKTWNPVKSFAKFDLTKGTEWPKSYFVVFALAEIDMGGFPDFLNDLVKKVADEIKKNLAAYIGGVVGAASGGIVGLLIGLAVGYAVDRIFDWLRDVWNDDVFQPVTVSVELASSRARWSNGSYVSPEIVSRFSGHHGEYQLAFDWRLIPGPAVVKR